MAEEDQTTQPQATQQDLGKLNFDSVFRSPATYLLLGLGIGIGMTIWLQKQSK